MSEQPSIEVKSWPRISYAMAHNGIPFIDEVLVRNPPTGQGVLQLSVTVTERGSNLTKPWSALIDSPGGPASGTVQPITFDSTALADIKLDPSVMADIEEQRPAEILVELTAGGVKVAETRREIRTLAPRQWLFIPGRTALSLSLLGAFIMPNDPVIGAVVAEARELLRERTGDSSTPGYQLGAERVDQMAEAIWDAMRARDISYSNPPASWDLEGQKVRTPHDVLEARVGTCLDTSVVLAAALEHVGINSVICVVEGHAFLAYWRVETSLGTSAMTDAAEFKNLCDLDALRVVETTAVTGGTSSQSIDGPARSSTVLTHLSGDLRGVHGVVDTQACRNADIVPLPASRRKRDGTVEVFEYRPLEHSGQHSVASSDSGQSAPRVAAGRRPVPPRVQRWKNALLDLSLRNKLINFADRSALQLAVPDGALGHVEDVLNAGRGLLAPPVGCDRRVREVQGVHASERTCHSPSYTSSSTAGRSSACAGAKLPLPSAQLGLQGQDDRGGDRSQQSLPRAGVAPLGDRSMAVTGAQIPADSLPITLDGRAAKGDLPDSA